MFLNAKNVSLNFLMQAVRLESFDLDLTTIKAFIVSLERNGKRELFKKKKQKG